MSIHGFYRGARQLVAAALISAALGACAAPPPAPLQPSPTGAVTPSPSPTVTATPTTLPLATPYVPVYQPADVQLIPPEDWIIEDPRDPSLPDLIIPHGAYFRVDPSWQVDSIEYLVDLRSQGPPQIDYQAILRSIGGFTNGTEKVPDGDVQAFLESLTHLRAITNMVSGHAYCECYQSWKIELTGHDGRMVVLRSDGVTQPDAVPWNIYFNGRFYAQYDGSLVAPLVKLLSSNAAASQFNPKPFTYNAELGTQNVTFHGEENLLPEYVYGFSGLVPVSNSFSYTVDTAAQSIQGSIDTLFTKSSNYVNEPPSTVKFDNPVTIRLLQDNGDLHDCQISWKDDHVFTGGKSTTFTCHPNDFKQGAPYHYHVSVDIRMSSGKVYQTQGNLYGQWGSPPDFRVMPPPQELAPLFASTQSIQQLLSVTKLVIAEYRQGQTQRDAVAPDTLTGEAVFAGEALIDGEKIRYTISTPFVIQDYELRRWDLRLEFLKQTLEAFAASRTIQRFLHDNPGSIVNLWYAKPYKMPELDVPLIYYFDYQNQGDPCQPQSGNEPQSSDTPSQYLSLNSDPRWPYGGPEFMTYHGAVVVNYLSLTDLNHSQFRNLLPPEIVSKNSDAFDMINFHTTVLTFGPAPNSVNTLATYHQLFTQLGLPFANDGRFGANVVYSNAAAIAGPDGVLKFVPCSAP